jgi:hypothetical protein
MQAERPKVDNALPISPGATTARMKRSLADKNGQGPKMHTTTHEAQQLLE